MGVGQLDAFLSQILVGSALFASNTLTLVVAGKLPRRVMLLTCSLGLSVTLAIMGLCYQLDDWEKSCEKELQNLNSCNTSNATLCSEESLTSVVVMVWASSQSLRPWFTSSCSTS